MNPQIQSYKQFAEAFALKAGAIIKENFKLGMNKEFKSDFTPVTETDLAINHMLIKEVELLFPDHAVKGEEESSSDLNKEFVWVCDPVDGTIPFSSGIPISTFSLALVQNGKPIVGAVFDPFQDRLYIAAINEGATLNGKKINVSKSEEFNKMTAAYEMYKRAKYNMFDLHKQLIVNEDVKLFSLLSIIYPSMLVAAGEFGFTIFPGKTGHDGAAVKIIVEEAGGKVTDIYGEEQRWDGEINGFIASNGIIHDKLVALCKEKVIENK